MSAPALDDEQRAWIVSQATAGRPPEVVLRPLLAAGWSEQTAIEAVDAAIRGHLVEHARRNELPPPVPAPAPPGIDGRTVALAGDREVHVLATVAHPRIAVLGGLLSDDECDALIDLARSSLRPSTVVDPVRGGDQTMEARTSTGMSFARGANALCRRIEERIARLLDWPVENGEGLHVLRYATGAEYRPHYDYFDPGTPGAARLLARGGQRVASLVMYLNTAARGGATVFPESRFEVAAIKGNAVYFTYDRPHPMTRSLHGGAPVLEGEKWIATKWLRERRHD